MTVSSRSVPTARGIDPAQLAMWVFVGTVTMLFAAFVSSYLIRRTSDDWIPVALPSVLWLSTGLLLMSSVALESARAALERRPERRAVGLVLASWLLGAAFLVAQLAAWRELVGQGVYVPTSPHSSFFYILTGLHGLHLVGGLAVLCWCAVRLARGADGYEARRLTRLTATYWHFLAGLWVFLYLVLARL